MPARPDRPNAIPPGRRPRRLRPWRRGRSRMPARPDRPNAIRAGRLRPPPRRRGTRRRCGRTPAAPVDVRLGAVRLGQWPSPRRGLGGHAAPQAGVRDVPMSSPFTSAPRRSCRRRRLLVSSSLSIQLCPVEGKVTAQRLRPAVTSTGPAPPPARPLPHALADGYVGRPHHRRVVTTAPGSSPPSPGSSRPPTGSSTAVPGIVIATDGIVTAVRGSRRPGR
jgi:hypothetical protein